MMKKSKLFARGLIGVLLVLGSACQRSRDPEANGRGTLAEPSAPTAVESQTQEFLAASTPQENLGLRGQDSDSRGEQRVGEKKPFKRALVMVGAGTEWPLMVGIYDALVDGGEAPDLLIGTCGASHAVATIQGEPNLEKRKALLVSGEMHEAFLKGYTINYKSGLEVAGSGLTKLFQLRKNDPTAVLDLWGIKSPKPVLCVSDECRVEAWDQRFETHQDTRAVIVASRLTYGPADVGVKQNEEIVYQPVYITDGSTAELLRTVDLTNPNRDHKGMLAIGRQTEVLTRWTLFEAARASIVDPFLVQPFERSGTWYAGGVANLMPVELALSLADEVVMVFREAFKDTMLAPERTAVIGTWGFDPWERSREVHSKPVHRWVDTSDLSSLEAENLEPKIGFAAARSGVPTELEAFQKTILKFYDYGYSRGREALSKAPGSVGHIRWMTPNNASEETLARKSREMAR